MLSRRKCAANMMEEIYCSKIQSLPGPHFERKNMEPDAGEKLPVSEVMTKIRASDPVSGFDLPLDEFIFYSPL